MSTLATIGIYNNLSARKPSITMRTTNYKLTCGVYIIFDIVMEKGEHTFGMQLLFHPWHENIDNIVLNPGLHGLVGGKFIMLCGNYDGVYALRDVIVAILHCHLTL